MGFVNCPKEGQAPERRDSVPLSLPFSLIVLPGFHPLLLLTLCSVCGTWVLSSRHMLKESLGVCQRNRRLSEVQATAG